MSNSIYLFWVLSRETLIEMFPQILFLDIDECVTKTDNCDTNAACGNNEGSFSCSCNIRFSGNGTFCQAETILIVYNKDGTKPVLFDISG